LGEFPKVKRNIESVLLRFSFQNPNVEYTRVTQEIIETLATDSLQN